jgi:hypothetical protein
VKQQNPRIDLLLTGDESVAAPGRKSAAAEPSQAVPDAAAARDPPPSHWLDGLLAVLLVLCGVTGAVLFRRGRSRWR